jgi:hypothetical protein
MKVKDVMNQDYQLLTHIETSFLEFEGCYATDLLSAAIKSSEPNNILITIISHINTIALAVMVDLPVIIISEGRTVTDEMIERANLEHIAILHTTRKTHEVVIDLFQRGFL